MSSTVDHLSPHFTRRELQCPHCRECFIRPRLLTVLEAIRDALRAPLPIRSGYRCPVHNHAVGGATNSQHVMGAAADLPHGLVPITLAARSGAIGIGTFDGYAVHVDVRDGGAARWSY